MLMKSVKTTKILQQYLKVDNMSNSLNTSATFILSLAFVGVVILNLSVSDKNKKTSRIILYITAIFFVFVFSGNSSSGDIPNYIAIFRNPDLSIQSSPLSAVFYYIMKAAKTAGMNFFQFKIIIACISYILYYRFFSKFDANIHYVIIFYCLHLFLFDVEQIRNALALSVYLQGLIPLLKNEKNQIRNYVIFTLLASVIHISFILYLIFLLYYLNWNSAFRKIFVTSIFLFCFLSFLNGNRIPGLSFILSNFDIGGKVDIYFGNHMRFGFLVPLALHMSTFVAIWYIRRENKKYCDDIYMINVVYKIIIISFAFLPLYMLSITFGRFERNLISLVLLSGATIIYRTSKKHVLRWKATAAILFMVICWAIYDVALRPDDILIPIMNYNYFINGGIYYYN